MKQSAMFSSLPPALQGETDSLNVVYIYTTVCIEPACLLIIQVEKSFLQNEGVI